MFNVESLERAELGESLLTWIQTFNVEAPCQTVEDLTSGVVMAQVLQKIFSGACAFLLVREGTTSSQEEQKRGKGRSQWSQIFQSKTF